ncbi:MAG: hypothetical protein ABI992_09580 [Chthoniobacterales bacterium]
MVTKYLLRGRLALLAFSFLAFGCSSVALHPQGDTAAASSTADSRARLRIALVSLDRSVSAKEAARLSECAHRVTIELAQTYGTVGSPHFQNFLVNIGYKKRGLCFQWTEDLLRELQKLHLQTLQLHWGDARAGTLREHNSVVVTARGQPFADGIVLDGWRHSGRLFWSAVRADDYPWKEEATGYIRRLAPVVAADRRKSGVAKAKKSK